MKIDKPTLEHYLKFDEWTTKEAALIINGFHPDSMRGMGNINGPIESFPTELHEAVRLYRVFRRSDWSALDIDRFVDRLPPLKFATMAAMKGIECDPNVSAALIELEEEQEKRLKENATGEQLDQLRDDERESLYKIIIGWAIRVYGYDPEKRNSRLTEMREDIEYSGLSIDDDTLRKWLKKASSILQRE